jgi:uncharacterized membrane protein
MSHWVQTFGRLHVVIVHFPIALLLVAGVMELWRLVRRRAEPSPAARMCLGLGAIAAVIAVAAGLVLKTSEGSHEGLIVHQWFGISTAVVAVLLAIVYRWKPSPSWRVGLGAFACAILVSITGYFGGEMSYGKGYLTELLFQSKDSGKEADAESSAAVQQVASTPTPGQVDFNRDIKPIFVDSCYECHSSAKRRGGLRLDAKSAAFRGGNGGVDIVPGKPDESQLLLRVIGSGDKKKMPLNKPALTDAQTNKLRQWIAQGANWPEAAGGQEVPERPHWAFVKPVRPNLPGVKDGYWPRNEIDYFVLNRLEKEGIKPSAEADKATLCRRVYLDLVGLPPTPEQVDAFIADSHADAYERLVDKLLDSPHYGERWGRHWLDVARYADTNGYEKDNPRSIWAYRDWVINALNADKPFDQFVIEQMAGDMLPNATPEQVIATGFHRNSMINEEGGIDVEEFRFKSIVDRVQTTSTALLGLTLHCAQCHDHKYDPFTQKEYYQFFGLLNNADEPAYDLKVPEIATKRAEISEKVKALEANYVKVFPATQPVVLWQTPTVVATTRPTRGGQHLLVDDEDGTILATGPVPKSDEYEIQLTDIPPDVLQVRLDVLTDPSFPKGGPGRAGGETKSGNFVLTQVEVFAHARAAEGEGSSTSASSPPAAAAPAKDAPAPAPAKKKGKKQESPPANATPIRIASATADFSQVGFDVSSAITGNPTTGWAVYDPKGGYTNHTAIFKLGQRVPEGTDSLTVRLKQDYPEHTIGKFRLSLGYVKKPATQPTDEQRKMFLAQQQAEWEKTVLPQCAHWTVLNPVDFHRSHDGTIHKLDDNSLLAAGDNFYKDQWAIEFSQEELHELKAITGVRLEVLADPSLPRGGPGRNFNGGFFLSEFQLSQLNLPPTTAPTTIETAAGLEKVDLPGRLVNLTDATASDSPASVAQAIDGQRDTAWTVNQGNGTGRSAVFGIKDKLTVGPQTRLGVGLLSNKYQSESVGRVRVSVTADEHPKASGVPAEVEAAILVPLAQRTPEQAALVRDYYLSITPYLDEQHQEVAALKATMPAFPTTMVLQERDRPRVTRVHHRGEYLQPEKPVEPGLPEMLGALPKGKANRLSLARWMVSDENPLTTRVIVNRLWAQYFGRGIVTTVDDFGTTGQLPTHPELLDWLATEFVRQHWSLKQVHRLMVTSATYRQSSVLTPELEQKDPNNALYARGPRVRVEAEIVRDIALEASGLLSEKIGGPSVYPPQPEGVTMLSYGPMAWQTSKGEDRYRRGLYTFLKRTSPYPGLITFDAPTSELVCPKRPRSNTPLQALTTLNDEVFLEAARAMGGRVRKLDTDLPGKARYAFRLCVAREPTREELTKLIAFYAEQWDRFKKDTKTATTLTATTRPTDETPEVAAWTLVSRALLNLDETITKE